MRISQKCQYALKAVLELARQGGDAPISIAAIGQAQSIPPQFLQVIMRELRQGGFVESRRGKEGGYLLARKPADLLLGDIIRFLESDFGPSDDHADDVFAGVWNDVQAAVTNVVDGVTFADLVERDQANQSDFAPDYVILVVLVIARIVHSSSSLAQRVTSQQWQPQHSDSCVRTTLGF